MYEAEEQYLKMQLAELQRSYLEATEPILKRLANIYALRQPPPIMFDIADIDPSLLDKLKRL